MGNRGKYNEEKVLYLADDAAMLHVDASEVKRNTTLSGIVKDLVKRKMLECIQEDEECSFYKTTLKGSIHLVKLQIKWRKANGKETAEHEARLKSLRIEQEEVGA